MAAAETSISKPKKFFKSRNSDSTDQVSPLYGDIKSEISYGNPNKRLRTSSSDKERKSSLKHNSEKTVLTSNVNITKRTETKPPIVLRICHGKSQLLNDSDESESTPTPSSIYSTSSVTSPRTLRENPQRSPSARITRSTRRSMQQDPNSSPAKADTPGEFSLFTSPKNDLSPQYIPAEKYELERKAMYDNLLRPSSPVQDAQTEVAEPNTNSIDLDVTLKEEESGNNTDQEEEDMEIEETDVGNIILPEPVDNSNSRENAENDFTQETENIPETDTDISKVDFSPKRNIIEEDWSTDSDSDGTVPEEETKVKNAPIKSLISEHKDEILEKILEKPTENQSPVKLVITKKKGSIFKSRSMVSDGTKKRRALYKHKWCDTDGLEKKSETQENVKDNSNDDTFGFQDDSLTRVPISKDDDEKEIIGVKCTKNDKGVLT